jgi:quercetin dioxygenase-like cupin family protein
VRTKLALIAPALLAFTGSSVWGQQGLKATPLVKASTTPTGQKLEYPRTDKPEISALLVEIAPGGQAGRHMHPVPTFVYVLEGTLTVELEDGSRRQLQPGQASIETLNTWHDGKNLGSEPLKFVVVYMGEEGKPNTVRPAAGVAGAASPGTISPDTSGAASGAAGAAHPHPGASPK